PSAADGRSAACGSVYECWRDGTRAVDDADRWLVSTTSITTDAAPYLAEIHDRMPLALPPEAWDAWLDPAGDARGAADLLGPGGPHDDLPMGAREGSTLVNPVTIDGPGLHEPGRAGPPGGARRSAAVGPLQAHGLDRAEPLHLGLGLRREREPLVPREHPRGVPVDEDGRRVGDVDEARGEVDARPEHVAEPREHASPHEAHAHGRDVDVLRPAPGLGQAECDARARRDVVGHVQHRVADGLDDATAGRRDDVARARLEELDELGELARPEAARALREGHDVREPHRPGQRQLVLVHGGGPRVGELDGEPARHRG